ncbi:hypothetical protein MKX03_010194 [Papaver bracteatum]|nr:hypothetical protein MKX03_010194 [Papaver bracteatum]
MPITSARNPKVPTFILLICSVLGIIKVFISFILQILGFGKFTGTEQNSSSHTYTQEESHHSVDFILTSKTNACVQDSCAICLCEYEDKDEIRPLINCCHIFHGGCLDSWMINNQTTFQTTCPLCRTSLVPTQI